MKQVLATTLFLSLLGFSLIPTQAISLSGTLHGQTQKCKDDPTKSETACFLGSSSCVATLPCGKQKK